MVTQEEINARFIEVIRMLKGQGYSQTFIGEKADLGPNTISRIKSGKNNAGEDVVFKLCNAFNLNPEYFYKNSPYMTMEEKAWANVESALHNSSTPTAQDEKTDNLPPAPAEPLANIPDMSSVFNAALAAKDEAIESLKRELCTKDDLIQSLREQLVTKDKLIAEQKARLIDYRHQIDKFQHSDISNYPFPIGAAEDVRNKKQI